MQVRLNCLISCQLIYYFLLYWSSHPSWLRPQWVTSPNSWAQPTRLKNNCYWTPQTVMPSWITDRLPPDPGYTDVTHLYFGHGIYPPALCWLLLCIPSTPNSIRTHLNNILWPHFFQRIPKNKTLVSILFAHLSLSRAMKHCLFRLIHKHVRWIRPAKDLSRSDNGRAVDLAAYSYETLILAIECWMLSVNE